MNTQNIWNLYAEDLQKFLLSKTHNSTITEDLLQDVFLKIHLKKEQLKDPTALKSWIFTIANHTLLDHYKTQQKSIPSDLKEIEFLNKESNHNPKDCLLPLINNLPEKYKSVLLLATIKGYKQTKVAEELNLSLAATKSRILRGKDLLKQSYMDCCNYTLDENGHLKGEHKNIDDCKVCRVQSL